MILSRGSRGQDVKHMQEYLTALGFDTNGVDGIFGGGTEQALADYWSTSVRNDEDITFINGFCAYLLLNDTLELSTGIEDVVESLPWLEKAMCMYLDEEIKGDMHSEAILDIWKDAKLGGIKDDETPWCAGAVSAWLERSGIKSMRSAWARAYLDFGTKLLEPRLGAIVVFERGKGGHVGFVTGITECGTQVRCLGGNQGDCVNERMFPVSRVLGYRQPEGYDLPPCPVVMGGENSKGET